jgi:hypothetical protein
MSKARVSGVADQLNHAVAVIRPRNETEELLSFILTYERRAGRMNCVLSNRDKALLRDFILDYQQYKTNNIR